MHSPSDFGYGVAAKVLYWIGGFVPFVLIMAATRTEIGLLELPIWYHLATIAFPALCAPSAKLLSRSHRQTEQSKRDRRAAQILKILRASRGAAAGDFSLFLRAFETTGRMPFESSFWESGMFVGSGMDVRSEDDKMGDFEAGLAEAVEKETPLVALGRPGEQLGAGRALTTDEQWQEDLRLLANHAKSIFLLPSSRPSVIWELNFLIESRLLEKVVWVQPPRRLLWWLPIGRDRSYDWKPTWTAMGKYAAERSIEFPPYNNQGSIFTVSNEGRLIVHRSLKGHAAGPALRIWIKDHLFALAAAKAC
jgi:hypothetical protein